jgi:hypothetical protein
MPICHWKVYSNMSLKRIIWHVLLYYRSNYYSLLEPIKAHHEERSMQTHKLEIMGSKEPEPWSPRWLWEQLREDNNGLPPNDPNHDHRPPTDAEIPLCKCDLDCTSHMSLDHDTYGMRYWPCPLPTSPFNWGWDDEKPRKVVLFVHLHCIFLIMSSLTIIFYWRVFALNFSHHRRNC